MATFYQSGQKLNLKCLLLSAIMGIALLSGCSADLTDEEYVARAETALNAGDLRATILELKNALRINPMNARARLLLGRTYFRLGDGLSSSKELRRAREMGIAESDVMLDIARAELLAGNFESLLDEFPIASDMPETEQAELHAIRGMADLRLANIDAAQASFDSALALDDEEAKAALGMALIARAQGNLEMADEWVRKTMKLDRNDPELWSLRGDLAKAKGDLEQAEADYGKAIQRSRQPEKYLLQRALLRIDLRNYADARADIARLSPTLPGKNYAAGLIDLQNKKYLQAQTNFEVSLTRYEDFPPAQYYLGLTHVLLGNEEQAQSYLRQFLAQVPESIEAANLLAKLEIRQGNLAAAEALLDPIFQKNPEQQQTLDLMAGLELIQGDSDNALSRYRKLITQNPESANARSKLGMAMILGGELAEGTAEMQRAIELAPEDEKLELKLVQAQIAADAPEQAIVAARQWIERKPDSVNAHLALAWSYLNNQQNGLASRAFENVLELRPGDPSATHNLAVMALYNSDVEQAVNLYKTSQSIFPGHPRTSVALARIYRATGELDKAIALLETSRERVPQFVDTGTMLAQIRLESGDTATALDEASALYESFPENPGVLAVLGASRAASGKYNQAINAYEQLESLDALSAHNHYLLAMAYYQTGNLRDFARTLEEAHTLHPDNYVIQVAAAGLFIGQGKADEAQALVEKLLNSYPREPEVYEQAAKLARLQQDWGREVEVMAEMRELQPDDPTVTLKYAFAQWRNGQSDAAYATLEKWIAENPDARLVEANLANLYMAGGRDDQAIDAFTRIVERDPTDVLSLNNLAWLLRERNPQRALAYAESAYKQAAEVPPVMDTLGLLLLEQGGDDERAIALLRGAAEAVPGRTDFQYHLAKGLAQTGQQRQAARVLSTLLRAQEEFPERAEAEALLTKISE